jgi:hypothetical protein
VYARCFGPSVLPFSLSLYRHPFICILFRSRFTSYNKFNSVHFCPSVSITLVHIDQSFYLYFLYFFYFLYMRVQDSCIWCDHENRCCTRLTIISTRVIQCMRGVSIPPFYRLVSHYTDTHLYVFSLDLALPLIINSIRYTSSVPLPPRGVLLTDQVQSRPYPRKGCIFTYQFEY